MLVYDSCYLGMLTEQPLPQEVVEVVLWGQVRPEHLPGQPGDIVTMRSSVGHWKGKGKKKTGIVVTKTALLQRMKKI